MTTTVFTPLVERPGSCQHPTISDAQIIKGVEDAFRYWNSDVATPKCPDCDEWLYPSGEDPIVVYVGEPKGAGDDPYDRPSSTTNPEAWTE